MNERNITRTVSVVLVLLIATIIGAVLIGTASAGSSTLPVLNKRCAYVQGGVKASKGDLNIARQAGTPYAAVAKVCWTGAKGDTGATGATGPAGPAGADGADANIGLPVCASNGGNLKLCGGDEGHDPVGYLVAAE